MKKSSPLAAAAAAAALLASPCLGFTTVPPAHCVPRARSAPTALRDQADLAGVEASYFQMQQIPTATSGDKLDRILACSGQELCDVDEMMDMIDELEALNAECQDVASRECNLDAVAARNVLKVALASKVAVEDALARERGDGDECVIPEDDDDPFAAMAAMEDCGTDYARRMPTATAAGGAAAKLDRIVECAEGAEGCGVDEMLRMVGELETLNMECEGALSRECSLDAVAARNILKVALASRAMR